MLNKYILSLSDINDDSKIHIEEHNNEDKIRFITGGQQRMIISNSTTSGNIGIGLNFNNPTSTLDIQGDLAVSNKIGIGTSTVETSLDVDSSLKVFDVLNNISGYVNTSDGNYMKLQATSRTDTSTKKNILLNPDGGNVGIGTTNPTTKLEIEGTAGRLLGLHCPSTNSTYMSFDNDNTTMYIGTDGSGLVNGGNQGIIGCWSTDSDIAFYINSQHVSGQSKVGRFNGQYGHFHTANNVAIGNLTANPSYPLSIYTSPSLGAIGGSQYIYRGGGHGDNSYWHNLTWALSYSIYAEGTILTKGTFVAVSDSRIKHNIEEIQDDEALIKFRQLKPCKYNYIDTVEKSTEQVYGFIAQEVKTVLPYAVNILTTKEAIPNIYTSALYNNNVITFDSTHNLNSNGTIKLILPSEEKIIVPYTIVDTLKINIDTSNLSYDETPSNNLVQDEDGNNLAHNIFVYGTEVDDFHTLNKNAIWTTAAAALQEVDRIQQADAVKIQTLETEVSTLKTKNTELETKYNDLLARITALENN